MTNSHALGLHSILAEADLKSLDDLGIRDSAGLLGYQPALDARLIKAAVEGRLRLAEVQAVLTPTAAKKDLSVVFEGNAAQLRSVSSKDQTLMAKMGLRSIRDLANWALFDQAEAALATPTNNLIETDPAAADCLVPRCRKFTSDAKSYQSFVRDIGISELSLTSPSNATAIHRLFQFGGQDCKSIYLGYGARYRQTWTYWGIHLGEPLGSAPLSMAQDTRVTTLDWRRINQTLRTDDARVTERLTNLMNHQRAVDEIARATAEEHQYGATSSVAANAATAGSFVAAGAIVGGVGGGVSGALAGLVLGNAANAAGATPTLAGAAVGTAVGSVAGGAAGSIVYSGATALGFVETEVEGERDVAGSSGQRIQERALQNASSLRSLWARVATQTVEEESQSIGTERLTNYNKIHALNALYFEILNRYRVALWLQSAEPILFLPFRPFTFDREILRNYWWVLRTHLRDARLIAALDQYFNTPTPLSSPTDGIADLPEMEDVDAEMIEVELDFDGSGLRDRLELALAGVSTLVTQGLSVPFLVGKLLDSFYDAIKRDSIDVRILSDAGSISLDRTLLPNSDPEYVGTYRTFRPIRLSSITGIQIQNRNSSLTLGVRGILEIDFSEVVFEAARIKLRLANRSGLVAAEPNLASLENSQTVGAAPIRVGGNSDKTLDWPIAELLANRYAGITEVQDALDESLSDQAALEAQISNLLGFLNANKFGFTRLILSQVEQEQLSCVLDQVELGGQPLKDIAGTLPIGISGGHILLPLKGGAEPKVPLTTLTANTKVLLAQLAEAKAAVSSDPLAPASINAAIASLDDTVETIASSAQSGTADRDLIDRVRFLIARLDGFIGAIRRFVPGADASPPSALRIVSIIDSIRTYIQTEQSGSAARADKLALLTDYVTELRERVAKLTEDPLSLDDISLPSPAIFLEPILSTAKGAELLDITRNANYDPFTAPDIAASDPNVLRNQAQTASPVLPAAVLEQQSPAVYALPGNLDAALGQVGNLSLQGLLQSNAATLQSTLTNLTGLATELAKASTTLTGDAQSEALDQAGKLANQIGKIVEGSLAPAAPSPTPAPEAPSPPKTSDDKGKAINEIKKNSGSKVEEPIKGILGAPDRTPKTKEHQIQVLFEDEFGAPYQTATLKGNIRRFEDGEVISLNGGLSFPADTQGGLFMSGVLGTTGRKATLTVELDLGGVLRFPKTINFAFPSHQDITITLSMTPDIRYIQQSSVDRAVDTAVDASNWSASLKAGVKELLELTVNQSLNIPFKVIDLGLGSDQTSSTEGGLDVTGSYGRAVSDTAESDSTVTENRKFRITLPSNEFKVAVT